MLVGQLSDDEAPLPSLPPSVSQSYAAGVAASGDLPKSLVSDLPSKAREWLLLLIVEEGIEAEDGGWRGCLPVFFCKVTTLIWLPHRRVQVGAELCRIEKKEVG